MTPDRAEMMQAGEWLEEYYRSDEGLQRPSGLVLTPGGGEIGVDWEGVGAWLFDIYFNSRRAGGSIDDAKHVVVFAIEQTDEWKSKHSLGPVPPLPPAPTRDQVCNGVTIQQGRSVHSLVYGDMPWWGACWAWLTPEDRAHIAPQLQAPQGALPGDTVCLIQLPDGVPLYDEPGQFYSPDKFGPLDMTHGNTQIDPAFVDLIADTLQLGFQAIWIFLGGDDGQRGVPIAMKQTALLGPALAAYHGGDLNLYCLQVPGWDGVF